MINYESVLLGLNAGGQLREKLYLVYPKEGIVTADYPLMLLDPTQREAYRKVVDYLRTPDTQRKIMDLTLRRPAIAAVKPDIRFSDRLLVELPFPNSLEVIDRLLFAYLDEQRRPGHALFVLDTSGSMSGERIQQLKTALVNLAGADRSLSGRFARFRSRERITFIPFSSDVQPAQNFQVGDTAVEGRDMQAIKQAALMLEPRGGTAIFSALQRAYEIAGEAQGNDLNRYYSIVLMTDGQHVAHERVADAYKTGTSPIYRSNGDGKFSIYHNKSGTSDYWVPHRNEWRTAPWNSGSGVQQQTWQQVWSRVRVSWVSWQLYARALGTSSSSRTSAYNNAMDMFQDYYQSVGAMDSLLSSNCAAARSEDILVYGIAFEAPDAGKTAIKDCASKPSSTYFFDANGLEIQTAFQLIAANLSQLRLTQ